jgi:hypothetical protein
MKTIEKNGLILRVSNEKAYEDVEVSKNAKYIPKSEWKTKKRDVEAAEATEKKTKKASKKVKEDTSE